MLGLKLSLLSVIGKSVASPSERAHICTAHMRADYDNDMLLVGLKRIEINGGYEGRASHPNTSSGVWNLMPIFSANSL